MSSAPATPAVLDHLAARIAQRDLPPAPVVFDPGDPAQFVARLLVALAPLLPGRNRRGHLVQARMLYEFVAHDTRTTTELARAVGLARVAVGRAQAGLVRAGLLGWSQAGVRRAYRLTRWGEDWLLALGRAEPLPARPA